ncbi:oxidoreductase [Novosphingobium sp. PC22D]|uniref:SDR family NAD(P)-dependent oxidoreductase n=1 Tax=Novosphingobium sp. PC22D TaxID=1962403 RepID=UPI000BF190C8|nr:SDR family NAD(P)-dependent oxidoreductase [Novosphingobium sp. PC22D]PEQ13917.1 oxidoreductase [Novosphingobium sp. PC22D]
MIDPAPILDLVGLEGRKVIVAGAGGGGMGTMIARLAGLAGATIVAADRSAEGLEAAIAPLRAEGITVAPVVADIASEEGVAAIMAGARDAPGALYGLVTVVGGVPDRYWGPASGVTREDWHAVLDLNLDTMFFLSQAVARELRAARRPGSLVAISSISGLAATPFHIAYGVAKAAVNSAVKTMAVELAADAIRVNAVAPGAILTPTAAVEPDPERDRWAVPMARQGRAEEIAATVLFLLSDMAGYITGQCLAVDGGVSVKWSHLDADNVPAYARDRSWLESWRREDEEPAR